MVLPGDFAGLAGREPHAAVDVEPPEPIFLPRRQRVRADRLDVDQCQQGEHLEQLLAADHRRELRDHLRVLRVTPEGYPGHLSMVPNQEAQHLGGGRRQLQPVDRGLGDAEALARMSVIAPRADVVQQQGQGQELGRAQLLEQAAEAAARRVARVAERLDPLDRQHDMRA